MDKSEENIEKKVEEILRLENWRGIEVLAEALGLYTATATEFVNGFYEGNYRE